MACRDGSAMDFFLAEYIEGTGGLAMKKLTLSEKFSRLRGRLHDREWRRYGMLLLGGKLAGIALLLLGVMLVNPGLLGFRALAADPVLTGNDIVNPVNTA